MPNWLIVWLLYDKIQNGNCIDWNGWVKNTYKIVPSRDQGQAQIGTFLSCLEDDKSHANH